MIDIAPTRSLALERAVRAVRQIVDELVTEAPEGLVAYRLGRRYSPVYEPLAVER